LWFSAVNSNDVSKVEHLIEQHADVNALEVCSGILHRIFIRSSDSSRYCFWLCTPSLAWCNKANPVYASPVQCYFVFISCDISVQL